jgi:nucleotide-binding universal stress UspA family protein
MTEAGNAAVGATVVVGVDGSAGSNEALRWAVVEARLRKSRLRALHALKFDYEVATVHGSTVRGGLLGSFSSLGGTKWSEIRRAAEDLMEGAIAGIAKDADDLEIEREIVVGDAADVLINAVGSDDLLVVGSRGHGEFAELLLGSVSQYCAHHAPCPVVIVRTLAG